MVEFFTSGQFVVFATSLALLILLFCLKKIEIHRQRRFGEGFRVRADVGALRVKALLETGEHYLEQTPWFALALARYTVHVSALSFARAARFLAVQAHLLADLVSHKHRFERRETKSKYLREVSEIKNGKNNDDSRVATP